MMNRYLTRILWSLTSLLSLTANAVDDSTACPVIRLETERLPDLCIPRAGHQLFYAGGEYVVVGGHTDGFVPTPTAEYYQDGKWHTMPMTYTHDFGISVVLSSGRVLLAGGAEQPTGIGQTFTAELYNSETHSFRGFGNMQRKRLWASALELDSGRVVIAGNWYEADGIEIYQEPMNQTGDFEGKSSFTYIKDVSAQRSTPYIFRIGKTDALILGTNDTEGNTIRCTSADRLKGDTLHIPLFETWQPLKISSHHDEASQIGNETYLLPVQDSTGLVAIARVSGLDISLLPTASAIPMQCQGDEIEYTFNIIADRKASRAYLIGISRCFHTAVDKARLYVLGIDYAQHTDSIVKMTLYQTDSLYAVPDCPPILTPEGNLLMAGGAVDNSNYTPSAAVWLLRLGNEPASTANSFGFLPWIILGVVALVLVCLLLFWWKRNHGDRNHGDWHNDCSATEIRVPVPVIPPVIHADDTLIRHIIQLMENERLFLNPDLKLSDLASALGTNRSIVSSCINSQRNCSFTQFVNTYRVNHAKELMRRQPDIKILEVWIASGFTSESYFFRAFKADTGMTPSEWKNKID